MVCQKVLRIFASLILISTIVGCGNLSAEMFGKAGSILSPSLPGTTPLQYPKILKVDADTTGASSVSTLALPRYTTAGIVPVQVHFSGPVNVSGNPTIELETGATKRLATYASGSGTNTLIFEYEVVAGDSALTLDYTGTQALNLNGGTIEPTEDVTGTADEVANLLTLPAPGSDESLANNTPVLIRTVPEVKRLSTPDTDVYLDGTSLEVVVKYDQPVTVTGSPRITIRIGSNNRIANYVTKVSPSELLFRYEVQLGDDDTDGIEMPASIDLNGGSVLNPANEVAVTDLPVKDTTGVLTYTSALTASFVTSSRIVQEQDGTVSVPVILSAPAPLPFKVTVGVMGDAGAEDFILASKEVAFAAGESTKYLTVQILNDAISEPEKRIRLILSKNSLGNGGLLAIHEIHIKDDDSSVVAPVVVSYKQGEGFACALYDNKELKCFGANQFGQLGDGTTVAKNAYEVSPVMTSVETFDANGASVCASNTAGEVYCWGNGGWGVLPGADASNRILSPRKMINSGVAKIVALGSVYCFLKSNVAKELWCWGDDSTGIFGMGAANYPPIVHLNNIPKRALTSAVLVTSGVIDVRGSSFPSGSNVCVLKTNVSDGTKRDLYCWGMLSSLYYGGDQFTVPSSPIAMEVTSFHLGSNNICVQKDEGAPAARKSYCWGENFYGQMNPGVYAGGTQATPKLMDALYKEIVPTQSLMCGLRFDGSVWCWGSAEELPAGGSGAAVPLKIIESGAKAFMPMTYRSSQTDARCVQMEDDSIQCWNSSPEPIVKTTPVTVILSGVQKVSVSPVTLNSYAQACSLMISGEVLCWGQNSRGQIGDRTLINRLVPTQVLSRNQIQVVTDRERSCSVSSYGELRCWGRNTGSGTMGVGGAAEVNYNTPKLIISKDVKKVALYDEGGCAVLSTGALMCWGANDFGQSKPGSTIGQALPNQVLASGVRDVAASYKSVCYVTTEDKLYCWGANTYFQLGTGTTTNQPTLPTTPLLEDVKSIFMGGSGSGPTGCAIMNNNDLKCWGNSNAACMGMNSTTPNTILSDVRKFSAGPVHACAITGDEGKLVCWGGNHKGQLGTGDQVAKCFADGGTTVVSSGAKDVSAGNDATCFVLETGEMKCMGDNDKGVIGTADKFPYPRTIPGL